MKFAKKMFLWDGFDYKKFTILTEKEFYTIKCKYEIKKYLRKNVLYNSPEDIDFRYWRNQLDSLNRLDFWFNEYDDIYINSQSPKEFGNIIFKNKYNTRL